MKESLPKIPILALTSDEVPGQEQTALEAGAYAVLTKAASRAELINKLREFWAKICMDHSPAKSEKEAHRSISP